MKLKKLQTASTPDQQKAENATHLSQLLEAKELIERAQKLVAGFKYPLFLRNHLVPVAVEINRQIKLCEPPTKK
jgi:hypothetical protein